jgi:hypothetical protein
MNLLWCKLMPMSDDLEYIAKYRTVNIGLSGAGLSVLQLTEAELSLPDKPGAMVGYGQSQVEATLDALRNATVIGGLVTAIQAVDAQQQALLTQMLFGDRDGGSEEDSEPS